MFLVVRKDFDLKTGQLVNLFVERVVVGDEDAANAVKEEIANSIIKSYTGLNIKHRVEDHEEGKYIIGEIAMCIIYLHEVTNGSMALYHKDIMPGNHEDYVDEAARSLSALAEITVQDAKGILGCFGYEIDGKPVMLVDKHIDSSKQVGMEPDEFRTKYEGLLTDVYDPEIPPIDSLDYKNIQEIMTAVDTVCYKHHVDRKFIYDRVTVGDRTLAEWSKKGVL